MESKCYSCNDLSLLQQRLLELLLGGSLSKGSQRVVCNPGIFVGVENYIPPMFIHALYSISSEAAGGPSSEVKLNQGVFLEIPLPAGFFWEQKQTHLTYY